MNMNILKRNENEFKKKAELLVQLQNNS